MTRGLSEISRLGVAFGADPLTFIGLSGVGDLIVSCTSIHSRNWRCEGPNRERHSASNDFGKYGNGCRRVETCKAVYALAQREEHRNANYNCCLQCFI